MSNEERTFDMDFNRFMDLTNAEFKMMYFGLA